MQRYSAVSRFFEELKDSPLAKDGITAEEIAVWLDMNGLSNAKKIWKIIYECCKAFHSRYDWLDYDMSTICHQSKNFPTLQLAFAYATDNIFKNIFTLLFKTNCLDNCCFSDTFIGKVHRECMKHKKKIRCTGRGGLSSIYADNIEISLFEVLAELEEKLITKKSELLQA